MTTVYSFTHKVDLEKAMDAYVALYLPDGFVMVPGQELSEYKGVVELEVEFRPDRQKAVETSLRPATVPDAAEPEPVEAPPIPEAIPEPVPVAVEERHVKTLGKGSWSALSPEERQRRITRAVEAKKRRKLEKALARGEVIERPEVAALSEPLFLRPTGTEV